MPSSVLMILINVMKHRRKWREIDVYQWNRSDINQTDDDGWWRKEWRAMKWRWYEMKWLLTLGDIGNVANGY